jgi:hypothetical protein
MISERREIMLDADAVMAALQAANLVPPGPRGVDFDDGAQEVRAGGVAGAVRLRGVPLLAAVLALCRARGVPVPRQAAKRLRVRPDGLVLEILRSRPAA